MSALTTDATAAETAVLDAIRDMYDAFIANDRARFDSHLDAQTTTWESHFPRMYTRAELDGFRDRRTAAERPVLDEMRVEPRRIEVWGDTAIAAYLLVMVTPDGAAETTRITDVLRLDGDEWRIVHHHAQARAVADADEMRADADEARAVADEARP